MCDTYQENESENVGGVDRWLLLTGGQILERGDMKTGLFPKNPFFDKG